MVRAVKGLAQDQIAALLEALSPASSVTGDSLEFVRVTLKERLAALDPMSALELGRQKKDPQLRSAAVLALLGKNAADGLRALVQLPEAERAGIWSLAKGIEKPGGSLAELTALIKSSPELTKSSEIEAGVEGCAAVLVARRMAVDPEGGLAEMRQVAADLRAARLLADPKSESKSGGEQQLVHLTAGMMLELRELSPEAARKVFDSLSETEKNRFIVWVEAEARLKESGAEAAIRFAEAQPGEDSLREAARGIWRGLAQQDRTSALQWLESLPAGSFRQGVLDSIRWEASMRNRSLGPSPETFLAGTELLSRNTQLEYFEAIASKNPLATSEYVSSLPLSEADKQELRRRLAPVKVK
jgi:hypothetical protein